MGDFLGFTFGGVHSSDLGIVRISNGNDFTEQLTPEMRDITVEIPGLDGQYYFGSSYSPKSIDVEFAFDSLTESQFRRLRRIFGTKENRELIFDERPYKKYIAKISSPIELSFVCFDERIKTIGNARDGVRVKRNPIIEEIDGEEVITGYTFEKEQVTPYVYSDITQPIYKGKGKITFECYFPFAKSAFKTLPTGDSTDWAASSGILSPDLYQQFDSYSNETGEINIYNAGDLKTGFRLYCPFSVSTSLKLAYIPLAGGDIEAELNIQDVEPQENSESTDIGMLIDTNTGLIQGVQEFHFEFGNATYITSGNLYNRYVKSGYFFQIDPSISYADGAKMIIRNKDNEIINTNEIYIFYDYLYF